MTSQGCCIVGNLIVESGFAKGRKPFDWGFGGCAPDYLSLFSAAEGGKKRLCNSTECDVPVIAFYFVMMYTQGVGWKKDDGNRKEYTISELAYHLGCDRKTRTEYSKN